MTDNKYDEDVLSQLSQYYSREEILAASAKVVDYKDINAVLSELNSNANTLELAGIYISLTRFNPITPIKTFVPVNM